MSSSLVRVQNFAISLDGFGTGEGQSADLHFGHAGDRLHEWMFTTRAWQPGGSAGIDDAFVQLFNVGIGAEIMGAGKFGHPGWHEDPEWKGAWGPNPPFHTPVFVLTHHTRPSIEMEGGTTYHFLDASPAEALEAAREAANGQDVRLGGGPSMIRDFLAAGLVDHLHVVVVPILLGRGVRLWDGLEGLEKDYAVASHVVTQRRDAPHLHPRGSLNRRAPGASVSQRCKVNSDDFSSQPSAHRETCGAARARSAPIRGPRARAAVRIHRRLLRRVPRSAATPGARRDRRRAAGADQRTRRPRSGALLCRAVSVGGGGAGRGPQRGRRRRARRRTGARGVRRRVHRLAGHRPGAGAGVRRGPGRLPG